jgi:hypothetical protein
MSISGLLIVLSACASIVLTGAVPEPMVTALAVLPRQLDDDFIGYYSTSGKVTCRYSYQGMKNSVSDFGTGDTARCATSMSWTVSGSYGRCCTIGSSCAFVTSCSGDYMFGGGTSVSW